MSQFSYCFFLRNDTRLKFEKRGKTPICLYTVHRVARPISNDRANVYLQEVINGNPCHEESMLSSLEAKVMMKIPKISLWSEQFIISKDGESDLLLLFVSNTKVDLKVQEIPSKSSDVSNAVTLQMSRIVRDVQLAFRSKKPLLTIFLLFNQHLKENFFLNTTKLGIIKQKYPLLLKVINVALNRIGKNLMAEFSDLLSFIDMQFEIFNKYCLSIGAALLITSVLNFLKHEAKYCAKLTLMSKNIISYIALFTFLDDSISILSDLVSYQLPPNFAIPNQEVLSVLFHFLYNNDISFHYVYQNALKSFAVQNELVIFNRSNKLLGLNESNMTSSPIRSKLSISNCVSKDVTVSPLRHIDIQNKKTALRINLTDSFFYTEKKIFNLEFFNDINLQLSQKKWNMSEINSLSLTSSDERSANPFLLILPIISLFIAFAFFYFFSLQ